MLEDERKHLICLLSLLFVIHKYNHALKVLFSTIVNQKRKETITFLILHVVLYKQMQTFIREYILTIVNQKRKRTLALLIIRTLYLKTHMYPTPPPQIITQKSSLSSAKESINFAYSPCCIS